MLVVNRTYKRLSLGLTAFGHSLARQKAESHIGLMFLVGGFASQLVGYLWPHSSGLHTGGERLLAGGLVAAEWLIAIGLWKTYVPRRTAKEVSRAGTAVEEILAVDAGAPEQ